MPVLLSLSGISLCVAAGTNDGSIYIYAIMFGIFCYMLMAPMVTLMWREQIDTHLRGRLFSQIGLMTMLLNLGFSYWSAWYIGDDIERYPPVILCAGRIDVSISHIFGNAASAAPASESTEPHKSTQ